MRSWDRIEHVNKQPRAAQKRPLKLSRPSSNYEGRRERALRRVPLERCNDARNLL